MAQIWRLPSQRKARPAPAPPPRVPAIAAALEDEFHARPFGSYSVTLPSPPPAPPAQAVPLKGFEIEPPPWANLDAHPELLAPPEQPDPRPPAHSTMKPYDPPPLGPPAPKLPPLPRIVPPKPDWEMEEKLAIERNKRERLEQAAKLIAEHALNEEQPTRHPPPRREPS